MAKRTFVHFEKKENALFSFLARDFELFGEIAQGLFEEELVRVPRGCRLQQGRQGP
jgi:hypothetical protein